MRIALLGLLLLVATGNMAVCAEDKKAEAKDTNAVLPELWFPVGEELYYKIYWGFMPVGMTKVTTEMVQSNGVDLVYIKYRTRSNKVIAKIYPVDDLIEALIEPNTFRPVKFVKNLKEGRHRNHEVTTFDYEQKIAKWKSLTKNKESEYAIEDDTRDLVTFMYFMRAKEFEIGKEEEFKVMADEKIYELFVKAEKKEKVVLDLFGEVDSIKLVPEAKFEGLFVRKGKMSVWVSDDDRRLCTKMEAEIPVANIKVLLCEVYGPGEDSWVKLTKEKGGGADRSSDSEIEEAMKKVEKRKKKAAEGTVYSDD